MGGEEIFVEKKNQNKTDKFSKKPGRSILENWSVKEGGVKNILYPAVVDVCTVRIRTEGG